MQPELGPFMRDEGLAIATVEVPNLNIILLKRGFNTKLRVKTSHYDKNPRVFQNTVPRKSPTLLPEHVPVASSKKRKINSSGFGFVWGLGLEAMPIVSSSQVTVPRSVSNRKKFLAFLRKFDSTHSVSFVLSPFTCL